MSVFTVRCVFWGGSYQHVIPNRQGAPYSLSAISLAITELPKALLAAGGMVPGSQEHEAIMETSLSAIQYLAKEVGDAAQLCDALAGSLRQLASNKSRPTAALTLECVLAALRTIPLLKEKVGD